MSKDNKMTTESLDPYLWDIQDSLLVEAAENLHYVHWSEIAEMSTKANFQYTKDKLHSIMISKFRQEEYANDSL